ncbi:MAG: FHA domain-containing protein, partial [Pseudobdellovibrionaceae bacterium]
MSSGNDEEDWSEKTNVFNTNTVKIKVDTDYQVPPCLVLLVGPANQMGKQWLINKPSLTLGRSLDAEIHVAEASVSKNHARIDFAHNKVTIMDLGSTNHTLIDDKRLPPNQPHPLKNNDQIR